MMFAVRGTGYVFWSDYHDRISWGGTKLVVDDVTLGALAKGWCQPGQPLTMGCTLRIPGDIGMRVKPGQGDAGTTTKILWRNCDLNVCLEGRCASDGMMLLITDIPVQFWMWEVDACKVCFDKQGVPTNLRLYVRDGGVDPIPGREVPNYNYRSNEVPNVNNDQRASVISAAAPLPPLSPPQNADDACAVDKETTEVIAAHAEVIDDEANDDAELAVADVMNEVIDLALGKVNAAAEDKVNAAAEDNAYVADVTDEPDEKRPKKTPPKRVAAADLDGVEIFQEFLVGPARKRQCFRGVAAFKGRKGAAYLYEVTYEDDEVLPYNKGELEGLLEDTPAVRLKWGR
jgi:hypothetical protein